MDPTVYTIGHSTHSFAALLALLRQHEITAVADVRSAPYSRMNPQFNREALQEQLQSGGIQYLYLGAELGARSEDPSCYENGRAQYGRIAATWLFQSGLDRVQMEIEKQRLALMCAEKEPLECHRSILVARHLAARGVAVQHILADGSLESQDDLVERLMRQFDLPEVDLFRTHEDIQSDAYDMQESRIAYRVSKQAPSAPSEEASW